MAAAEAIGVSNFVAQSYAGWNGIREGGWVKTEQDPLDMHEGIAQHAVAMGIRHVEDAVVTAGGAALRYGWLYGPGSSEDVVEVVRRRKFPLVGAGAGYCSWLHLDDVASVARVGSLVHRTFWRGRSRTLALVITLALGPLLAAEPWATAEPARAAASATLPADARPIELHPAPDGTLFVVYDSWSGEQYGLYAAWITEPG